MAQRRTTDFERHPPMPSGGPARWRLTQGEPRRHGRERPIGPVHLPGLIGFERRTPCPAEPPAGGCARPGTARIPAPSKTKFTRCRHTPFRSCRPAESERWTPCPADRGSRMSHAETRRRQNSFCSPVTSNFERRTPCPAVGNAGCSTGAGAGCARPWLAQPLPPTPVRGRGASRRLMRAIDPVPGGNALWTPADRGSRGRKPRPRVHPGLSSAIAFIRSTMSKINPPIPISIWPAWRECVEQSSNFL
jgi:hypothetical protein